MSQLYKKLKYSFLTLRYINTRKLMLLFKLFSVSYLRILPHKGFKNLTPFFISVEPADFCQLECPECPVGSMKKKEGKFLDESIYYRTIDELYKHLFHVIFYFQGEPLLNKKLHQYIQYAHNLKLYTSTSTNGLLLTKEISRNLVASGLDKLIVSVDGATQETYEQYRIGAKLNRVIDGIRNIQKWRRELHSTTPMLELQFIVLGTNEHDIDAIKKLAKELHVDRLVLKTAQMNDFENPSKFHTSINRYSRYKLTKEGKYILKNKTPNRCFRAMSGAVLSSSSDILPCCYDKGGDYSYGKVTNSSFLAKWNNKKASDFRTGIIQNRMQYKMCRNCTSK